MKLFSIFSPERRWVLIFALVVMFLTTLPYIVGFVMQGDDWRFTGFVFGVEDGNSYVANMLSGENGSWLFKTPYTGFSQRGVIAFLPYILLGKLASSYKVHEQLIVIFHLFRIVAGVLAIIAMYDFLKYFLTEERLSKVGLVLVTLGGGLGWIQLILGLEIFNNTLPLDFYSPEAFGFLSLYGIPHLALARAALFWGLLVYLKAHDSHFVSIHRNAVKMGIFWLIMALAQPLTAVVFGIVLFIHAIALIIAMASKKISMDLLGWDVLKRTVLQSALAMVLPMPFLLYNFYSFTTDPFLIAWMDQNIITSPSPINYIYAYLLVIPLAIIGSYYLLRNYHWKGLLLVTWVITVPILIYIPVYMQRRLIEGIWVVLITLVMVAIKFLKESKNWRLKKPMFLRFLSKSPYILLLVFPSTIILLMGGFSVVTNPSHPIFHSSAEIDAFKYFESIKFPYEMVLTSYETGNALPAWAPVRVVIGHGPLSIDYKNLDVQVSSVYHHDTEEFSRKNILSNLNIRYVFWGPEERKLGNWDPNNASYLNKIYDQGGYSIFEFIPKSWSTN